MHRAFQDLLHSYKIELFKSEHEKKNLDQLTSECLHITEDVLKQKFHYHFHQLPDANRAEIINMIQNYVREAILPPVVERIVARQLKIEHRFDALQNLVKEALELLSKEPPLPAAAARR